MLDLLFCVDLICDLSFTLTFTYKCHVYNICLYIYLKCVILDATTNWSREFQSGLLAV